MNPFAQNPIEFADNAGIRIAEKLIAVAYRKWRINPVTIRHWPRAAFVVATTGSALLGPGDVTAMVILSAVFALSGIARLLPDLPSIRDGWNARTFRTYSAKALKERESTLLRRVILCVGVTCITVGTSIVWSISGPKSGLIAILFAFFLLMELSILFSEWMAAAELPEPDDGDFVAAPQPT